MKPFYLLLFYFSINACYPKKPTSIENIEIPGKQDSLFQSLVTITHRTIPESKISDSLAFLILPLQASCPSCRKKTIDSIMKYKDILPDKHYIILSINGGRKSITGYFREQKYKLPEAPGKIFLDSTNLALKYKMYEEKPTTYYTFNRKAYKKVASVPATVTDDLHEFFAGKRQE